MTRDRLVPADAVETVDLDGDVLIWDGEMLHLLADWGAEIWRRIDGRSTAEEIATDVVATSVGPRAEIERDVLSYLDELLDARLLVAVPAVRGLRYDVPTNVGHVREEETLVLGLYGPGRRHTLSPTAARIWELAAAECALSEVVSSLRAEFPDAPDTVEQHVRTLLDQLVDAGLLVQLE